MNKPAALVGPKRVVTLLPSATEIVCALGHQASLVGRSHECDFPPSVKSLPALTSARLPVDASSAEIDRAVKSLLSQALSVYDVDAEKLAALQPDLVVTQSQCDVCAVSESDVIHALAKLSGVTPGIVSLAPQRLDDVWQDLLRVGEALGTPERAAVVVGELRARVEAVVARVDAARADAALGDAAAAIRPRVACIEWLDPLMAAGNWVPELVTLAGGENLFGEAGAHSGWLTWDDLRAADPDVIFVMPCGFDLARIRAELPALTGRPGWSQLGARVFLVDGNQYFNRPGPRLVDSLELLTEALWGLDFGRAAGWQKV